MKYIKTPKELKIALQSMNERQILYILIKEELERRGHWKAKPRGIPGFKAKYVV